MQPNDALVQEGHSSRSVDAVLGTQRVGVTENQKLFGALEASRKASVTDPTKLLHWAVSL